MNEKPQDEITRPLDKIVSCWPRGRYNGRKIAGVKVSFSLNLFRWVWKPILHGNYGEPYFAWLCFTIRAYAEYDS